MVSRAGLIILGLALVLSIHNVKAETHDEESHDDFAEFGDEEHEHTKYSEEANREATEDPIEVREPSGFVAKPKPIHIKDLPTMRFLFCVSCGYKNAFDQYSQVIREKYPDMPIEGTNYPPVAWKAFLAQFVNISKMVALVIIMTGANPFAHVGMGYPAVLQWAQNNKLSACMMTFLLSNMVEGSLMGTGAFEIFIGEEQIWSKLESGRVPSPGELMQMIDSQLELLGKVPSGGAGGFGLEMENQ